MSYNEIFSKSLVCWVFSGQQESKPDIILKTCNQQEKANLHLQHQILFSLLTACTEISAAAQLHECQATRTDKVRVFSADVHDHASSAYAAELLPASHYTFSSIDIFQIVDFFFFKCPNTFKCLHTGEAVFPHEAEGCRF